MRLTHRDTAQGSATVVTVMTHSSDTDTQSNSKASNESKRSAIGPVDRELPAVFQAARLAFLADSRTAWAVKRSGQEHRKSDAPRRGAKCVLWRLLTHMNRRTMSCFPRLDTLARASRIHGRQVSTHIATIERVGLLKRENRKLASGKQTSTRYTFSDNDARRIAYAAAVDHRLGCVTSAVLAVVHQRMIWIKGFASLGIKELAKLLKRHIKVVERAVAMLVATGHLIRLQQDHYTIPALHDRALDALGLELGMKDPRGKGTKSTSRDGMKSTSGRGMKSPDNLRKHKPGKDLPENSGPVSGGDSERFYARPHSGAGGESCRGPNCTTSEGGPDAHGGSDGADVEHRRSSSDWRRVLAGLSPEADAAFDRTGARDRTST